MAYKIWITPAAKADLDDILSYLINNLDNKPAAIRFHRIFQEKLEVLAGQPLLCEPARDSLLRAKGYRKLVIDNYIILYSVDKKNKTVHIARMFYGRRKYEDLV